MRLAKATHRLSNGEAFVNKAGMLLVVLLVVLGGIRLSLPSLVEAYANRSLAKMVDYTGSVGDIDIALIEGEYVIKDLVVEKRSDAVSKPLLSIPELRLGLQWKGLIRGAVVADVVVHQPILTFMDGASEKASQVGMGPDWIDRVNELVPFTINAFTVDAGQFRFLADPEGHGALEVLVVEELQLKAKNLTNVKDKPEDLHASVDATALVQSKANAELHLKLDPLSSPPELSLDATLNELPLAELNGLLRTYANVDAEAGTLEAYVEVASADGAFTGYVKPLITDANVFRLDERGTFFGKAWQAVVDAATALFENAKTERLGAQIPLSGELTAVDAELIPAIFSLLRNAFIEALSTGLANTVSLEDVKREDSLDEMVQGSEGNAVNPGHFKP